MKFFFAIFGCNLVLYGLLNASDSIKNEKVLLLSYPRSGNTWSRYCIEYLTKRPTGEAEYLFPINRYNKFMNNPINNNFELGVDYNRAPIIKLHEYTPKYEEKKYGGKYLILILRNYKECILRHEMGYSICVNALQSSRYYFFKNIKIFHNWDKRKRLLLYYEDLIENPSFAYQQIVRFFGEGQENIDKLLNEGHIHKANGIKLYERDAAISYSKGQDVHFHSKQITKQQRLHLDQLCKNAIPNLYDLYLSRYKEK